jgi:hypothetical protein
MQKNISARNIATATSFLEIDDADLREFTELILDIARLKPRKRRRWKCLHENHPDVLERVKRNPNFDWLVDMAGVDGAWPEEHDEYEYALLEFDADSHDELPF